MISVRIIQEMHQLPWLLSHAKPKKNSGSYVVLKKPSFWQEIVSQTKKFSITLQDRLVVCIIIRHDLRSAVSHETTPIVLFLATDVKRKLIYWQLINNN